MIVKKTVCVLFLTLTQVLLGQQAVQVGPEQGLGHPTVYSIASDPFGFVWMGTRDGLYRYNEGKVKEVFFLDSTSATLRTRNVQCLLVGKDSILRIGLQQGGLVSYSLREQRVLESSWNGLPEKASVSALYEDQDGYIWAGTAGDGLYRLNLERTAWERMHWLLNEPLLSFVFDFEEQGDTLWIANSGNGLSYYDRALGTFGLVESSGGSLDSYRKALTQWNGTLIVGVEDRGVFTWQDEELVRIPTPVATMRDVAVLDGELWISTDGQGIWHGRPGLETGDGFASGDADEREDWKWEHVTKGVASSGVKSDQFYNFHPTETHLWVGTFNAGASVFPLENSEIRKWPKLSSFGSFSTQSVLCMEQGAMGIYAGYDGDGLVVYDAAGATPRRPAAFAEKGPRVITSLQRARDSALWIGTYSEGLYVIDKEERIRNVFEAFGSYSLGLMNNNIWSLELGAGDSIWVGTLGGLHLWDGTQFSQPWPEPYAVGRNIMDLAYDGEKLFVATEFMGLFSIEGAIPKRQWSFTAPLISLLPWRGGVLVGTEGAGLYWVAEDVVDTIIAPGEFTTVYALEEVDSGVVAATNGGLLRLSGEKDFQLEQLASVGQTGVDLFNRKALRALDSSLVIGGVNGLSEAWIDKLPKESEERFIVTGLVADNVAQQVGLVTAKDPVPNWHLPAGTQFVEVLFEIGAAMRSESVRIEYSQDEGNSWSVWPVSSRNFAYSNLEPGEYALWLRLLDGQNKVRDELRLRFDIGFFFWQRRWFKILVILIIAGVIAGGAFLYQDRRMKDIRVKLLETEGELLALRARELEVETRKKSEELNFQLLKTSSRIEILKQLKERITKLKRSKISEDPQKVLSELLRTVNSELQSENYWDHFERNYKNVHEEFSEALVEQYPNLTKGEVRLSYLIHQKLSNKEMATVLNVSPAAVEKAKYRLKKKLELDKTQSLDEFILSL